MNTENEMTEQRTDEQTQPADQLRKQNPGCP